MSIEEILMIIAVATIATTCIQCIEMYLILWNQRRTNELLEDVGHLASDGVSQFIKDLCESKTKQAEFFGFVQMCGQHAIGAAKEAIAPKMPKIKSLGDVIGALFQMPVIQAKIEQKATEIVENAGKQAVSEASKGGWA